MKTSERVLVAIAMSLTMLLPVYATGTTGGSSEAVSDTTVMLEEVNIVAIKQEEKLRDEAVASTVIGGPQLEERNSYTIKDISGMVPNLYIPDYGSRITSSIYVRGLGARIDQPAVGLTIDNIPILTKNGYDLDMADIAAVEILRGPQSTLHGRNTMAGLINITTLSPSRYTGWRVSAQGATGNDWKGAISGYVTIGDKYGLAISASGGYLGGFYRNQYTGKRVGEELGGNARVKFYWRKNDHFYLENSLMVTANKQDGYAYESLATKQISYNDTCSYQRYWGADAVTLRWKQDKFTMTAITSLQVLLDEMKLDQDFLPDPYFTLTQDQSDAGATEDILFKGDVGNGKYQWLAGSFLFLKEIEMEAPVLFKDKGIAELIEAHRNEGNPMYPIRWDTREFILGSDFRMFQGGIALYHESKLNVGPWHLSLGVRGDWERSTLEYRSRCDTGYTIDRKEEGGVAVPYRHVDVSIDDRGTMTRDFYNIMPKVSVLYNIPMEGENNVYLAMTRGYKSGGFNTQMFSDVLQQRLMSIMGIAASYSPEDIVTYKPERSWNYEAGLHLSYLSGNLNIDLAGFLIDCTDQQVTMFPAGTTTGRIMANAGKARSMGTEMQTRWKATERLSFQASYGYSHAKFEKFDNGIEDYSGKYVPYVPQNTCYLQGSYVIPLTRGKHLEGLDFNVDVTGTGPIYWNESNTLRQNFYAQLGAGATLRGTGWSVQMWGRNLTASRYDTFYFMSMGNEFVQRGRPIQGGVTLRLEL